MMLAAETDLFGTPSVRRTAKFVDPGIRVELGRWFEPGPVVNFIGCNPSDADAYQDDPTSLVWTHFAQFWGFGSYVATNLYPKCTSSPAECRKWADFMQNGPDWHARDMIQFANLPHVVAAAKRADRVVACWGAIAWDDDWVEHVLEEIQTGVPPYPDIYCFGLTAEGSPKHPMARGHHRIPRDQQPILWRPAP